MSPKHLGALAELVFMSRAAALGLTVLRPLFPCRYDLVLDTGHRLLRIQVKSTATRRHRRYSVSCFSCDSRRRYSRREIDFLAAWIAPLDAWYLIPASSLRSRARVYFYPSRRTGWSERYRERWNLLSNHGDHGNLGDFFICHPERGRRTSPLPALTTPARLPFVLLAEALTGRLRSQGIRSHQ